MAIKLVVFEDNVTLRKSLESLFEITSDYMLVGTYPNPLNAKKVILNDDPDIVLMDIDMPEMDGISAISKVKEVKPLISVIMYTQFEDDEKLFRSLCAGADGYILKKTSPIKLFDAIDEVRNGGVPLSPEVARKVLNFFSGRKNRSRDLYGLTEREAEVLHLLVKGYSIKLIASQLNIAFDTCRSHLRNIYIKLHVHCGKEAIAKVLANQIKL